MTPPGENRHFRPPPLQILHPPHRLSTAGRKSVCIASLFSLFSFAIFLNSTKRIFPNSGVPYYWFRLLALLFSLFIPAGARPFTICEDGDAMSVAREISQDFLRAAEWALAIDHPLFVAQRLQIGSECSRIDKPRKLAEELQLTGPISGAELVQEQSAEQFREHGHRQEEARAARDPALSIER